MKEYLIAGALSGGAGLCTALAVEGLVGRPPAVHALHREQARFATT